MKTMKKGLCLLLVLCLVMSAFAGCKDKPTDTPANPTTAPVDTTPTDPPVKKEAFYKTLDKNVEGTLDIMCWSGDSVYYEDIGAKEWKPEEITTQNVAAIYALAKEFKKLYPKVKINLWAKTDDPDSNDTSWYQELENFKAAHGKYPDVYASTDLAGDVAKGFVADLSVFSDDVLYQSFNQSVMKTMAYYGFQAGLPQFMQPWGVFVNTALAEANNIEVPDPAWTIDEYTDFVLSADNKTFWGAVDTPLSFIATGSKTINAQLFNYSGTGDRVNIASDEVKDLLSYIPKWAKSTIWCQNGQGLIPSEIMDDGWWWSFRFFCRNYVLTNDGDPWMIGAAAVPQNADGSYPVNSVESSGWDVYPRPSTKYQGNTVGICVDPMAIHNYAMDDNNPAWSDAEKAKLDLAYAFGSYWCGATESFEARAKQQYSDNGTLRTALNDSIPLVTGDEFDKQMAIWNSTDTHKRFADEKLMPGWKKVMELWKAGQIWDISDKTYIYKVMEDGNPVNCLNEWLLATNYDFLQVGTTDPAWADTVKSQLSDWNVKINNRFKVAEDALKKGLKDFYGLTDADFK